MGIFITFEGIEGVGKTTQLQRLAAVLQERNVPHVLTREPGGTAFGQQLRSIILDPSTRFGHQFTEIMLFMADRLEHLAKVIEPALESGKVVLCDRFIDSTIAYQVGGRQLPGAYVEQLHSLIHLVPNKTVLLDVAPEEGLTRARGRAKLDRFEQETMAFHHRVRSMYHLCASRDPDRFAVIDTSQRSERDVFNDIMDVLTPVIWPDS
ncbi:dTMP kinase [bacterium]|nr:dTMP kinase [bacterium]